MDDAEIEVDGVDLPDGADGPNVSMEEAQMSLVTLESAIHSGNVEVAVKMAERLATMQAAVCATPKTDSSSYKTSEKFISITIQIEDQVQSRGTVAWKVQPSMSIRALKWKMFEKFWFSPDIQKWIIGNHVAADTATLSEHGITTDGAVIFLYLTCQQRHNSADYTPTVAYASQQSVNSSSTSTGSVSPNGVSQATTGFTVVTSQPQTSAMQMSQTTQSTSLKTSSIQQQVVGWPCPTCTLINEPTRPGCEVCATDRPADFKIPVGYQPSERERKRLEAERKLEELMSVHQSRREDSLAEHIGVALMRLGEPHAALQQISDELLASELQQQEELLALRYCGSNNRDSQLNFARTDRPPNRSGYNGPYDV